jgi:hypothetical protein
MPSRPWIWILGVLELEAPGVRIGGNGVVAQAERMHENIKAVSGRRAPVSRTWSRSPSLHRIEDPAAVNTVRRHFSGESRSL